VLAGDVDADTAMRLAMRHFGGWPAPGRALSAVPPRAVGAESATTAAMIDMPHAGQATVVLAVPLPALGDDRARAAVMNELLGGGYSSRLSQEIRIRRGLSYGAGSGIEARRQGAALGVAVQTKNESAAEVVTLVQAELDRLAAAPVEAAELAARKAALIGDFSRSVETTAGLGAAIRALVVAGVPVSELRNRIDALGAVTAEQVRDYAASHLEASRRRVVVAGEASRFATVLRATTPDLRSVPVSAFADTWDGGLAARHSPAK
jgi:zinc protease